MCRYILYLRRQGDGGIKGKKGRGGGGEGDCMVVKLMVIEGQCVCYELTFICTRQVGAAIPATLSDAVFTSTRQSKSSNLGKETGRETIMCIFTQKI